MFLKKYQIPFKEGYDITFQTKLKTKYSLTKQSEYVGLSLRQLLDNSQNLDNVIDWLDSLNEQFFVIDMHPADKRLLKLNTKLKKKLVYQDDVNISDDSSIKIMKKYTQPLSLKGFIGMRYHACVWAALNEIPFLALVYDDKVLGLAKTLRQPFIDLRQELSVNELSTSWKTYQDNIDVSQPILKNIVKQIQHCNDRLINQVNNEIR